MNILLICLPLGKFQKFQVYTLPATGTYRLQHMLEKNGFNCDILNTDIENIDEFCPNKKYDVIGITGTHFSLETCLDYVNQIRTRQGGTGFLIAGGVIPTYVPQLWLDLGFHAVILGYGEYPLLEICTALKENSANPYDKMATIDGIAYYNDGKYKINPAKMITRELFSELTYSNLKEITIPYNKYWKSNEIYLSDFNRNNFYFEIKTVNIHTSSHCPNRCGYCSGKFLDEAHQKKTKIHSLDADQLFDLVQHYVNKYKARFVYFTDDDFLFSKSRATAFAENIINGKNNGTLPEDITFGCQSRVVNMLKNDIVDNGFMKTLATAGFKPITLGAESCSSFLLKTPVMNKGGYNKDHVFSVARAMLDNGINGGVNFMVMLPDASRKDTLFDLHCAYELLLLGIEIRVTVGVRAQYGAPALQCGYTIHTKPHISPLNGYKFEIPQSFAQNHADMTLVMQKFDEIEPEVDAQITQKYNLGARKRNSFYAIARCIALAKALNDESLCDKFYHAAELWLVEG